MAGDGQEEKFIKFYMSTIELVEPQFRGAQPETAEYPFNNFEWKSSDVLVSAYPKTVSKYEVVENLPLKRRFLATHLASPLVNIAKLRQKGVKIVCVLRNPKDQAISWYNFAMSLPISKSEHWKYLLPEDEKKFYDLYIAGKQSIGAKNGEGYLESVREWYKHKNMDNVIFVIYEEIKKDPRSEIRKLAEFLEEPLNEKELNLILEQSAFSFMKEESESGMEKSGMIKMFRKGQVGDWKKHLTVAQSELIEQKVQKILGDTDIKFIYE